MPCAGVGKIQDADRCGFVKEHCKTGETSKGYLLCIPVSVTAFHEPAMLTAPVPAVGSFINYLQVYYCHVEPAGWTARLGFQVPVMPSAV